MLIGMPIFRKYAIRFSRGHLTKSLQVANGHAIAFAPLSYDSPTCASCDGHVPDASSTTTDARASKFADVGGALQPLRAAEAVSVSGPVPSVLPTEPAPPRAARDARLHSYSAKKLRVGRWVAGLRRDADSGHLVI